MSNWEDDDDDNTFEEIKKLQNARKNNINIYDDDDEERENNYNKSLSTSKAKKSKKRRNDSDDDDNDRDSERSSLKKEFESYGAPKHLLDTLPIDEDYDPLKKYRAPTVAEQETEYRSRWRKRGLSPPRDYDPFTGKGEVKGRSYKEIMLENQLAKEEKEILYKIEKKKKEEQELLKEKKKQEEYDNKQQNKKHKTTTTTSSSSNIGNGDVTPPSTSSSSNKSNNNNNNNNNNKWYYKIFKNGDLIEDFKEIKLNEILTFGRDQSRNRILLEHPSCSSIHASISFNDSTTSSKRRPILLDLNSTNKTFLNGRQVIPHKSNELYEGDKIKFGASTREYIIYNKR